MYKVGQVVRVRAVAGYYSFNLISYCQRHHQSHFQAKITCMDSSEHYVYIQMVGEWAEVEDSQRAERSQRSHFSPLELTVNKLGNFPHKKEEVEL